MGEIWFKWIFSDTVTLQWHSDTGVVQVAKKERRDPRWIHSHLCFSIRLPKVPLLLSRSLAQIIIASLLRFDPLCGEFNDKLFKESYQFVNEVKSRELVELKKQLKTEEDKERREEVGGKEKAKIAHICNYSWWSNTLGLSS